MNKIKVNIDGYDIEVNEGTTILNAAKMLGVNIPTLCYHPDQNIKGNCRVCVVEVEGSKNLTASCCTPVWNNMKIKTNTKRVRKARRTVIELILADHNCDCTTCIRNGNCELQTLCRDLNIEGYDFDNVNEILPIDNGNPSIVRDSSKCIKCGRCIEACHNVQNVGAIYNINRSSDMKVGPPLNKKLHEVPCVYCGQCISVCPVGAIYEKDNSERLWEALEDESKHVIVQIAPAVRVSLGEEINLEYGSIVTGKIVAFLRRIGFDKVFDTNFTADLTIMEEGNELLERINNGETLPMLTSCSPGWIRYIEYFYPELLEHVSTCKSPQQMFGALSKTYYANKYNIEPKDIVVVSIMPCTAKKAEANREEMNNDVDIVLTTRELGKVIKESRIDISLLSEEEFDAPFGISTGAGAIFGATGGVMEAALRTVYEVVTGDELDNIEFKGLRGLDGIKEAEVNIGGTKIKVAVISGLKNASIILDKIKKGICEYQFIEIMCCPGGCIGGGGQPIPNTDEIKKKRIEGIYNVDETSEIRKSHLNPAVKILYDEFLGKPLSEISHRLLHTHYKSKDR